MRATKALMVAIDPDLNYVETLRLHGGWQSARQVAAVHAHSWYVVAHALRRQVEAGTLEEDVIEVMGAKRVREHTRIYRARPQQGGARRVETELPAWLQPQMVVSLGEPRRVAGKAGMSRWVEEEGDEAQGSLL